MSQCLNVIDVGNTKARANEMNAYSLLVATASPSSTSPFVFAEWMLKYTILDKENTIPTILTQDKVSPKAK